jgi:hypothetical protein
MFDFRIFSYGEFKAEDQEEMLANLNKKVEEVYRSCIGDNEANIRQADNIMRHSKNKMKTIDVTALCKC